MAIIASPAEAHHSLSAYDRSTSRKVMGVVKEYEWANPHVKLVLVVTDAAGSARDWFFESGSIGRMSSRGFNRVSATPGEPVTVSYHPRRDGGGGGFFLSIVNAKGRTYGPIMVR